MTTTIETKEATPVMADDGERSVRLTEDLATALEKAARSGRWCIAVAWIGDDGNVKRHRETLMFPRADLVPFAQWLLNDLRGEAKELPSEPLPVANLEA